MPRARLSEEEWLDIYRSYKDGLLTPQQIAEQTGYSLSYVYRKLRDIERKLGEDTTPGLGARSGLGLRTRAPSPEEEVVKDIAATIAGKAIDFSRAYYTLGELIYRRFLFVASRNPKFRARFEVDPTGAMMEYIAEAIAVYEHFPEIISYLLRIIYRLYSLLQRAVKNIQYLSRKAIPVAKYEVEMRMIMESLRWFLIMRMMGFRVPPKLLLSAKALSEILYLRELERYARGELNV